MTEITNGQRDGPAHLSHHHHNKITSVRAVTLMDAALIRPEFRFEQLLPAELYRLNKNIGRVVRTLNQVSQQAQPSIAVQLTVHASIDNAYLLLSELRPLAPFLLHVQTSDWW